VRYVLKDPEAKAYFHGMKDKQLEFALFYRASGNILDCKSLVNLEGQKSLKASSIRFQMLIPVSIEKSKLPFHES
jgi:hypothetical protein